MQKLCVITGANRGIGLNLTHLAKSQGYEVMAVCRTSSPQLEELGVEVIGGVDVSRVEDFQHFQKLLGDRQIHVAIFNAGIFLRDDLQSITKETLLKSFEVNAISPLVWTSSLIPHFPRGAKVVLITSRMGSMADNGSGGYYSYRASKAALNAIGKSLSLDLKDRGVAVGIIHPGFVRTEMTGGQGQIDPPEAAANIWRRVKELTLETTGEFRHANGELLPF